MIRFRDPRHMVVADQLESSFKRVFFVSANRPGTSSIVQIMILRFSASFRGSKGSCARNLSSRRFCSDKRSHHVLNPRSNNVLS